MRPPSKPLPVNQEEFEAAVVASICRANPEFAEVIGEQFRSSSVIERWGSGVGFFVEFLVDARAMKLPANVPYPLDCEGYKIEGVESGAGGGMFFHKDGLITCLECYGIGSGWPEQEYKFEFYTETGQ